MIPYGRHHIAADDIEAVQQVLENHYLTQGQQVPAFEQALCDYTGAKHCVAVNSGTSGLHIACMAAGVSAGDIVWTVPNSFVASANAARYCGAEVDFVDIDAQTRNISLAALERKLDHAKVANKLPKALIVVHFAGYSCDMQAIQRLIQPLGIILIEDAAHGLGGQYQGKPIGSCTFCDMAVLSFHPVKSITTAEGGAVTTHNPALAKALRLAGNHGISRNRDDFVLEDHGPWAYQQLTLGYNYRLSDLHAALGLSQLKRLDSYIQARRELAARYHQRLQDLPVKLPEPSDSSAWHLYVVELLEHDRSVIFEQLVAKGVGVNVHYIPIHLQPYYQQLGFRPGDFPVAEAYYQKGLTLPLFPTLSADDQDRVIDALIEVLV